MFTGSNTVNVDKVYRFNHWDPPPIGRLKWKLTRPKYQLLMHLPFIEIMQVVSSLHTGN